MTVSLSSLRVVGEFDASSYARGAAQKVAADAQMIASDKARNAALAQADAAMAKVVPGVSRLSRSLLDGYGAGAQFEAKIREIGNAVDKGMGLDRANLLLDAAYRKFNMTADATALAQQGFVSIAPAIAAANERFTTASNVVDLHGVQLNKSAQASAAAAAATGLTSHELKNLGFQLNDVITMLASGSSPFQVMATQSGQVLQIMQGANGGISGAVRSLANSLVSVVTPARLAFGGIIAGAAAAALAVNSYLAGQQRVAQSLVGAGRASGTTIGSINAIAQSGSSSTGLSVSEARALAAELAATGKIGKDNLEPIVKLGHDIATVFGVDASEAAKMLATAFASPLQGAEQLNARLGFLNAAMQQEISNLVAQNRLWEAQRVLAAGAAASLTDVGQSVATTTKFWTALGNTASNAWDKIGAGLARATGIGLVTGLDDQLAVAKQRLDDFRKVADQEAEYVNALRKSGLSESEIAGIVPANAAAAAGIAKYAAEVDRLSDSLRKNAQATTDAQQRQASFAQAAAVRAQLPAIDQTEKLRNENELLVTTMISVQTTGGAASPVLKAMGVTYEHLAQAVENSTSKVRNFKTEFEQATQAQATQLRSLTAFTPGAKGDVAFEQRYNSELARGTAETKARALADGDRAIAIVGVAVATSEAARARELSSRQTIDNAQLEIDVIGKTIAQQVEMRANLQSRQALEQQLLQQHQQWGPAQDAEFERLRRNNAEAARRTEIAARAAVNDNISFGRQTALLSPDDVQIAQQLKGLYPDVATALASVEAAGLRTNAALSALSSTFSSTLTTGMADIFDGTKTVGQGFSDMSKTIVRALEEAMIKMLIVAPIMRSIQGMFGGGLPLPGASDFIGPVVNANGNAFGGSNVIPFRSGGAFTNQIFSAPTFFQFRNGGAMANGVMGEAGEEAVMPLRRGSDGRLGVSMVGGQIASGSSGSMGDININVNVPEGTGADDAGAIAEAVKAAIVPVIDERLSYHSRSRGMLNNAN